jgi:alkylated DNA repair dioxygenase AlkB
MDDLFAGQAKVLEPVPMPDADVQLARGFIEESEADTIFRSLLETVPWRDEEVTVWGKRHMQPRQVAWFGEPGAVYSYSGSTLDPLPWTPLLDDVRRRVESVAGATFNSVLINLYRSERDRIGWHSDSERELGPSPVIASLSLGAARVFQMKHKTRSELGTHSIELPSGSLLLMVGETQRFWRHSVRKESRQVGPRINLTFRRIALGISLAAANPSPAIPSAP